MKQYRSGSTIVEAMRLVLSSRKKTTELLDAMGAKPGTFVMPVQAGKACWWRQTFPNGDDKPPVFSLMVQTHEGEVEAFDGDWIVRGADGLFLPCKPDVFAATYEAVE